MGILSIFQITSFIGEPVGRSVYVNCVVALKVAVAAVVVLCGGGGDGGTNSSDGGGGRGGGSSKNSSKRELNLGRTFV